MKKRFELLSLLVVVSLLLTACGSAQPEPTPTATTVPEPTAAPVAPTALPEPSATPEPTLEPTPEPTLEPPPAVPGPATWTCPTGDRSVSIWHVWAGEDLIAIEEIFRHYMSICPNIKIELLYEADMSNVLAQAVSAGKGPDIVAWANDQMNDKIRRLARAGAIIPLTALIDEAEFTRSFIAPAVDAVSYNSEIYGFPESTETLALIYNRDLISERELPETTDDLLRLARDWQKSDYLFVYNAKNDAYFSVPWWQAAGVTIIDADGNTTFKSEAGYAAGRFIEALKSVMPAEIDYDIADALFRDSRAAMIMNGPWYIADLEAAGLNYGVALLPIFSPTNTPAMPFVDVKSLLVTQNAADRGTAEAAVNLLQYYTSPEAQVYLVQNNRIAPVNQAALNSGTVKSRPDVATFGEQALNGKPMPATPLMAALWEPIAQGLECIWAGSSTTEECVDGIQAQAEQGIAEMQ